ncbi:hypothetical protein RRG08_020395 [Elysia crispata]|uniref:Alpha-taxilin n=1 Tax=Elysia crispata TaxID=231223 RepID=A0AAE0Y7G3_9GAST|nr:hypothetical protein RRG08_020395 [Elysia crispata]
MFGVRVPKASLVNFISCCFADKQSVEEEDPATSQVQLSRSMSQPEALPANTGSDSGREEQQQSVEADFLLEKQPVVLDPSLSAALGDVPPVRLTSEQHTGDEREEISPASPNATVVPSNTPVTADSGQGSPAMQSSSESLSDDLTGQEINVTAESTTLENPDNVSTDLPMSEAPTSNACNGSAAQSRVAPPAAQVTKQEEATAAIVTQPKIEQSAKEAKRQERKEEKKKQKRKEDKGIEYILRALNSLQTPEEKLAALCKKYADLNEEHRVLQTSFKTQQRTMTVVMREKDQLQADHTRAMMAKSKLESLCRELQKHNKIIKEESIKRAKEDDEKRKEISAQFNNTIGEIQTQMNENTERNTKLRLENENLAAQLKAFINSIELRDQQVEKIQKHHELEKKLFEAKIKQAEAVLAENSEKNIKERELVMLKLAEVNKKNAVVEAQLNMYKERYAAFEQLSENIGKYKSEMDKMTKRIKKLEKDGLQWKTKWENSNKALIEQMDARSKSEKETLTYAQKTRKLESLCRALQAELHNKKPTSTDDTNDGSKSEPTATEAAAPSASSAAPPNSPEASSSGQCSPDSAASGSSTTQSELHPSSPLSGEERDTKTNISTTEPSPSPSSASPTVPSSETPVQDAAISTTAAETATSGNESSVRTEALSSQSLSAESSVVGAV